MKRVAATHAPSPETREGREVYCRRDNRVYGSCPHAAARAACPCLHPVETADALWEPSGEDTASI